MYVQTDLKIETIIKPCPWCKKTGKFIMLPGDETWTPHVECWSQECKIRPKGRYVSIRKTSKKDFKRFLEKVTKAISYWNEGNPVSPYEKTLIDLSAIANNFNQTME